MQNANHGGIGLRALRWVTRRIPRGRRALTRTFLPLVNPSEPVITTFYGEKLRLLADLNELIPRHIYLYDVFEPSVTSTALSLLHRGDIVLDVGANIGYFTLLFSHEVGRDGSVFSFEPEPRCAERLSGNLDLNETGNVELVRAAVAEKSGTLDFYSPPETQLNQGGGSRVPSKESGRMQARSVSSVTLDEFRAQRGIGSVALVKMDIEGGEVGAVAGMRRGLDEKAYRNVLMEVHGSRITALAASLGDVFDPFLESGYHCYEVIENRAGRSRGYRARHILSLVARVPQDTARTAHYLFSVERRECKGSSR